MDANLEMIKIVRFISIDDPKEFVFRQTPWGIQVNFIMKTIGYFRSVMDEYDGAYETTDTNGNCEEASHADSSQRLISCWSCLKTDSEIFNTYKKFKENETFNNKKIHFCIVSTANKVLNEIKNRLNLKCSDINYGNANYYNNNSKPDCIFSCYNKKSEYKKETEYRFVVTKKFGSRLMELSFCTDGSYINEIIIFNHRNSLHDLGALGIKVRNMCENNFL